VRADEAGGRGDEVADHGVSPEGRRRQRSSPLGLRVRTPLSAKGGRLSAVRRAGSRRL
jgi:hypothetical protein